MSDRGPLYNAFETVEHRRNTKTMTRYKLLPEEPGLAHALDVKNTREGDPWRFRAGLAGIRPRFFEHDGPRAACGTRVKAATPTEFRTDDPDSCPECAALVESGEAWGRWKQREPVYDCAHVLRIEEGDDADTYVCMLKAFHHGRPHRSGDGATWEIGVEDFTPAADGYSEGFR